jgi:hypothetical protein
MSERPIRPPATLETSREQTIEALCRYFAHDVLTVAEFEHRVDLAHRARDIGELSALLRDLPELTSPPSTPDPVEQPGPVAALDRPDRGFVVAIMGGATRKGRWIPAERTLAYTIWGGIELDFREAALPPGITELVVCAVMGGIDIIVPPGLAVDSDGVAILGGFDQVGAASSRTSRDAPVLRIRGLSLLGGVTVQVRLPGETAGDARRREKAERRRLRKAHGTSYHGH